ncbi:MAG: ANTAR domain-containing protein [Streptosporangiaceae bacterium]
MTGKRRRAKPPEATEPTAASVVGARAPGTDGAGAAEATGAVVGGSAVEGTTPGGTVSNFVPDDAVVRRTKDGWRVGSEDLPDLTCAMILADLLAAESGMAEAAAPKPGGLSQAGETGRLRATVGQLEHALATRIRVEQAIGVLAERHRIKPRQAFEQLREAARSRGRKVIDIAGDVVASATNPLLQLPDELSRPRSGPRRAVRPPASAQ